MKELLHSYSESLQLLWPKLSIAIVVFGLFFLVGKILRGYVGKKIRIKWGATIVTGFIIQFSAWAAYTVGLFVALNILGFKNLFGGLLAGAGLGAILIGFAFKDIAENFLAGILLAFNRPFEIGNIIEVEGFRGTVKKLNLRNTHIRNVEGKDIFIPNAVIVKSTLSNYTLDGNLRHSFMIGVAPETDIHATRKLILELLNKSDLILKDPRPHVLVNELAVSTVDMEVLFWVDIQRNEVFPDQNLGGSIRSRIIAEVKELLDASGVEMPASVLEHKMYRESSFKISS